MKNIGIYLYDQAEVLDFSGPFEVFTTASRVSGGENPFQAFLISEHGDEVTARAGYQVRTDCSLQTHPPLDALIVVGGVHTAELGKPAVIDWIAQQAKSVPLVAAVCTGAFLLAKAGLLHGLTVTTHWEDQADLQAMFPDLQVVGDVRWVDAGNRVTSGGISAGIDMSLHLVSRLHSLELAEKTARQMEFAWTRNSG
ncbi:MAG: DJ-1/PfpI family protein [Thiolinea sp.]